MKRMIYIAHPFGGEQNEDYVCLAVSPIAEPEDEV